MGGRSWATNLVCRSVLDRNKLYCTVCKIYASHIASAEKTEFINSKNPLILTSLTLNYTLIFMDINSIWLSSEMAVIVTYEEDKIW